jgi:divalent metal cation (Fe/Co/Zn/Cd) transporter
MNNNKSIAFKHKIKIVRIVLFLSVLIMLVKLVAYFLSGSSAILSDALESLINIAASAFTMFSIYYASKLRDDDHPYGHGKIEYVAVGFEGALIFMTGIFILIKSGLLLLNPVELKDVNGGLIITILAGIAMYFIGSFLKKKGKELHSASLIADGKHFHVDAVTSLALILGLVLYKITGLLWIDPLLAILLALHIMFSGFGLVKEAADRLLDKADAESIEKVTFELEKFRRNNWIDIHNLRIQKFGHYIHIDCHMTLPFYLNLEDVHTEIKILENYMNEAFKNNVELFIHTDPCQKIPCTICNVSDCVFRQEPLISKVKWTSQNLALNKKHTINS